ncbi:MAG: YjbH domain-containing protein [Proteobacteria bacterium]|nr:YjbH domain-containing protein [Pseudomonadota bacterium]
MRCLFSVIQAIVAFFILTGGALAEDSRSVNVYGVPGLITVPSARMDKAGTIGLRTGVSEPYLHGALGLQIASPLYIGIRQTARTKDITGDADRLYPGIDLRLRLTEEGLLMPAAVLGLQSAFGHKRTASEYLAFSKRYEDFDFTAGLAWGRLGSAAHISNPLKILGSHFGKDRSPDNKTPNDIQDWFTGRNIGAFGGIEYFTPLDGLSLKAEWGADRYIAEKSEGYSPAAPWSIGLSFNPASWINLGLAIGGGETIIGNLSLKETPEKWPWRKAEKTEQTPLRHYRAGASLPPQMELSAAAEGIYLYRAAGDQDKVSVRLELSPDRSYPQQTGRAVRHISNHAGKTVEEISLTPTYLGLRGPSLNFNRRDLEQAFAFNTGSPQEIWHGASFGEDKKTNWQKSLHEYLAEEPVLPDFRLMLDHDASLSEEDSGFLFRTSLIGEVIEKISTHFHAGAGARLNIADNLDHLNEFRLLPAMPIRSDVDLFASRRIALDRLWAGWMTSLNTDLHLSLTAGYLEEMYSGVGGEILYRPFGKTFAIGADAWQTFRRDPLTDLNMGLYGNRVLSGHINAWYEFPDTDITLQARIGRYLAEDIGGTIELSRNFANGSKLSGFITATDSSDFDIFGGATNLYSGIKISLPLGSAPIFPDGSASRISAVPLGRDTGQALDAPIKLYEATEQLSLRHISRRWTEISD